jgi:uncharacterized protein
MLFENQQIQTDELPKIEDIDYLLLQKNYKYLQIIQWSLLWIFITGIFSLLIFVSENEGIPLVVLISIYGGLALLYLLRLFVILKGFPLKGYALREHDILFRTGLIVRRITSVPLNRIQHSEVRQSFLARLLNITKLKIYTAGGSTSDLSIHGLTSDEAARIKDFLSKTISHYA